MSTITESNKTPADDTIQQTYFSSWGLISKTREDEHLTLSQVLY